MPKKIEKSSGKGRTYINATAKFQTEVLEKLFDICCCKCPLNKCFCPAEKKVPAKEREFLDDQRTRRLMGIGGLDQAVTKKLRKRETRQVQDLATQSKLDNARGESPRLKVRRVAALTEADAESDTLSSAASPSSSDFEVSEYMKTLAGTSTSGTVAVEKKLPKVLPNFSRALDRRGLSSRAGAQIASALLHDIGVVTTDDSSAVVDKSKVQRERSKTRQQSVASATRPSELIALYYDGRKDETLVKEIVDGKAHRKTIREEHISMVEEPGSTYIGHATPGSGSGADIVKALRDFGKNHNIDLSTMKAIGGDNTPVNPAPMRGAMRLMEEALQKNLQIVTCLLHLNELPLQKIMVELDGPTSGPKSFTGPIGKLIMRCEEKPVVEYEKIECAPLPEVDKSDLSTDQKYLKEMWEAVTSGNCPTELARRNPGNVTHARWLTLANRILRLYVGTENPTSELQKLADFVVKVYAPSWFSVKCQPSIFCAPQHFFGIIRRSRYLEEKLRNIVDKTLQTNGFMAHPESILIGMLCDARPRIRKLAVSRIQKARENDTGGLRRFIPSKINFEAKDYVDMINWQTTKITPPPLIADMTLQELQQIEVSGSSEKREF